MPSFKTEDKSIVEHKKKESRVKKIHLGAEGIFHYLQGITGAKLVGRYNPKMGIIILIY